MGNNISDDDSTDITRKAIIPFRVRNNGFQVDYKIFKFRSFAKAKIDRATDTKYDDSFLELNTRSKIVGDIRKVLTISAETISEEYSTLRKNYYSRILFGLLTFFIGLVLTNIGLVQNELPKGRIMIIFGGMLLMLTMITLIIVIYTDRRLKTLNKEFVRSCVKILEKEKIVTWTASFQHLLFDIIYPYAGGGTGAVILTPNPYFEMLKTTDEVVDIDIDVHNPQNNDKKTRRLKLPIPQWAIDESISEGPNEEAPLIKNDKSKKKFEQSLIVVPSDDNFDEENKDNFEHKLLDIPISAAEQSSSEEHTQASDADVDDDDNEDNEDNDEENIEIEVKKKVVPKAYIPFDDSKENIAKIHGSLIQRFFHENPEDIEGHGEDTALLENNIALQAAMQDAAK